MAKVVFFFGRNEAGGNAEAMADTVMDHNGDRVTLGEEKIDSASKLQLRTLAQFDEAEGSNNRAFEMVAARSPLRCWQFRLKELRIRTPSPMLGQAMFICVPSALWQWN